MPIEFNCESCSKLLRVPDGSGGKQCRCPSCSKVLDIPVPKGPEPAPAPANLDSAGDDTGIALCIPCPRCKHELICDPSLVGTKGQCRSCKHIFVINDLPTSESVSSQESIHWVFSCPKCNQLFEGNEAMEGKRGKCHACGNVFPIELRVADESQAYLQVDKWKKPTSSFDSFEGDLTLDVLADGTQATSDPTAKSNKQTTSSGSVVSKVSPGHLRPIQFNCKNCKGRMEVPGEAARQLTHCPHCKRQQTIPSESEPTLEALAANDPWADLSPLGSAPAPMPQSNPFGDTMYPPPMSMSSMSAPGGTRRASRNDGGMHLICGISIAICAFLGIAIGALYVVLGSILLMNPNVDHMPATIQIFVASIIVLLSLLQLVGGISLARRTGLSMARTGAILCCLPCICLVLNIPFGIWGCILTFGQNAERDFR